MTKILFVCHGNICRSPMAEFIMKDLVKKAGKEDLFEISSAATSREEIGNPVYPPAKMILAEHGISCEGKTARQMTKSDFESFDMIICMDSWNVRNAQRLVGEDPGHKISLLLDYTGRAGEDISDPWYTRDFQEAWDDILCGCEGLLKTLSEKEKDERCFRLISNQVRFGYGYECKDGQKVYFAFHGYPSRNDDFFTTAEISEDEFNRIASEYPMQISADRETAEEFRSKYVDGHPVILEGWNKLL